MVAAALARAGQQSPGPADRRDLEALEAEFADELRLLASGRAPGGAHLGVGVTAWVSSGPAPRESRLQGGGLEVSRAYLTGRIGEVTFQLGRDSLWWGPGFRGAFLLSDNAGPLEFLRLSLPGDDLRFTKLVAPLADPGRWLYAIRLDWRASDTLRLGLGEVMVGEGGLYLPYALVPIPLVNSVLQQVLRNPSGLNDNENVSLDFDWVIRPGVVLYGEVYIDDLVYPIAGPNPFPSRLGGTVGLFLRDPFGDGQTTLRFEHSRVTNWVYAVLGHTADYIKAGRSPGHWCGPDCELWSLTVTRLLAPDQALAIGFDLIRKGEGMLGDTWTDPTDAIGRLYLSGVVETTRALRVTYTVARPRGFSHTLGVTYSTIANAGHASGVSRQDWFLRWEAFYGF